MTSDDLRRVVRTVVAAKGGVARKGVVADRAASIQFVRVGSIGPSGEPGVEVQYKGDGWIAPRGVIYFDNGGGQLDHCWPDSQQINVLEIGLVEDAIPEHFGWTDGCTMLTP